MGCVVELHVDIAPTRADECRVKSLDVVGGQEQQATLLRRHAIDSVEQAAERDAGALSAVRGGTAGKHGVYILQ